MSFLKWQKIKVKNCFISVTIFRLYNSLKISNIMETSETKGTPIKEGENTQSRPIYATSLFTEILLLRF